MPPAQTSRVHLTAAATSALPRRLLLALCIIYGLSGLFLRDPWKNEDAAGFGVMWTLAHGGLQDWLLPNIVGRPHVEDGPLVFWIGALMIKLFGWLLGAADAARLSTALFFFVTCASIWYGAYLLGRRAEVQPFEFAFGGQPKARDYGRTLADGALLIFLACVGLAQRGHETTAQVGQMYCIALMLYGLIRSLDKPNQGALWLGLGIGAFALASGPVMPLALTASLLLATWVCPQRSWRRVLSISLPLALAIVLAWFAAAYFGADERSDAVAYIREWSRFDRRMYGVPLPEVLGFIARNLLLYTWPIWPLAIWAWHSWGGMRRAPHIVLPLALLLPQLVLLVMQQNGGDMQYILLLPPLAMLATFGLPTLKRSIINAIDWFAVFSFTILCGFVWLIWIAKLTGYPPKIARNVYRLLPGYVPEFSVVALLAALLVTAAWILIVRWRVSRAPKVIWRSVVISAAGATLMWVLMMTLWLPTINYAKTYRDVAEAAAMALPSTYQCVQPIRMGDAQLASFAYFGHIRFGGPEDNCDVLLRHDPQSYGDPTSISRFQWRLIWEGRRPSDRDERFRMYHLQPLAEKPSRAPSFSDIRRKRH